MHRNSILAAIGAITFFLGLGVLPTKYTEATEALTCNGQTFDHILEFKYEESGKTGCVGWAEGAGTCLYRDEWDTGRGTDSVECKLSKGKLKVSWFKYPGTDAGSEKNKLKATFRNVDTEKHCFGKMNWYWKGPGGYRSDGKGFPYASSICP